MVLMEVNHVSPSNQNRFRVIGLTTVIALFGYLKPLMAVNRVMRDHPDWIKKSGFGAKIPLPMAWHFKRLCVLGASLLVIGVGFTSLYKPQVQQQMYKIKSILFKWIMTWKESKIRPSSRYHHTGG